MTTIHGRFFSQENKEYVSTMVFKSVKDNLGTELDSDFAETLLRIMSETYTHSKKKANISNEEYVDILNDKVINKCYEKAKTTAPNIDFKKLMTKEFEARNYGNGDLKEKPLEEQQQSQQPISQQPISQQPISQQPISQQQVVKTNEKILKKILDFRNDLFDINENNYYLSLNSTYVIRSIEIKNFMIELCEQVVSEPYFYIDIENIPQEEKHCYLNKNKNVVGRMVQTQTMCNKSMYLYEPEDCIINLKNPLKTSFLSIGFYDYKGTKINIQNISIKKIIHLENNKNQILTNSINLLKPKQYLSCSINEKTTNFVLWECHQHEVKETKSNSIILENLQYKENLNIVMDKNKLNSNISLHFKLSDF
jgi:hypothetical protein